MSAADTNKVGIGLVILRLRETEAQLVRAQVRIRELESTLDLSRKTILAMHAKTEAE